MLDDADALRALVRTHGRRVTRLVLLGSGLILLAGMAASVVAGLQPTDGSETMHPALVLLAVGHPGLILLLFALLNHRLYHSALAKGRFLPVRIEGPAATDEMAAAALGRTPLLLLGRIAPVGRVAWSATDVREGRTVVSPTFSDEFPWLDEQGCGRVLSSRILGLPFRHLVLRRR